MELSCSPFSTSSSLALRCARAVQLIFGIVLLSGFSWWTAHRVAMGCARLNWIPADRYGEVVVVGRAVGHGRHSAMEDVTPIVAEQMEKGSYPYRTTFHVLYVRAIDGEKEAPVFDLPVPRELLLKSDIGAHVRVGFHRDEAFIPGGQGEELEISGLVLHVWFLIGAASVVLKVLINPILCPTAEEGMSEENRETAQ